MRKSNFNGGCTQTMPQSDRKRQVKMVWQRDSRRKFKEEHGYSQTRFYDNKKLSEAVLKRDNYQCVICGMTAEEHLLKWNRPINIHHKNNKHNDNRLDNMETLCLRCHGRVHIKQKPELTKQIVPPRKDEIMILRKSGLTYQAIADHTGFSIGAVWKWIKKWEREAS